MIHFAAFLFGSIVGSFLNVCIYRMPLDQSIVSPPSHCPNCNERIRWIEVAWFCLGIPLLALWIRRLTGAWTAGLLAAFRAIC